MWEIVSTLVDIELGWCLLNLSMELAICDALIYLVEGTSCKLACYVQPVEASQSYQRLRFPT